MEATATRVPEMEKAGTVDPILEFAWLPVELSLVSPLLNFRIRDLISLEVGSIVRSSAPIAGRILVLANGKRVACAQLEVSGNQLAARITELK